MSSITEQVQALLEAPDPSASHARVRQFMDGVYLSFDPLESLDEAASQANRDSIELRDQLGASSKAASSQMILASSSATTALNSAKELSLTRHSLVDLLSSLSEQLLPPTNGKGKQTRSLLQDIQELHERLQSLEAARTYFSVLERAAALSEDAVAQVKTSQGPFSEASLARYQELQCFVDTVAEATEASSIPSLKLVEHLRSVRDRTWSEIYNALSERLQSAAEKLQWPTAIAPSDYLSKAAEDRRAFESAFVNLLLLQKAGESLRDSLTSPDDLKPSLRKGGLFPLQSLVHPLALRFKYHFDGQRQTNRPDKPEWYFTHVLNLMHEHKSFMEGVIQSLLQRGGYEDLRAQDEFIRLLCGLPSRKLKNSITLLLNLPALLAHTIYQTLIFDSSIREGGFQLSKTWEGRERLRSGSEEHLSEWDGLTEIIVGKREWFEAWLQGEKKFAETQYHEMISSSDAWQITDDAGDTSDMDSKVVVDLGTRTTTSARRFKALIERVTERYSPLPQLHHKVQFLFDIQIPLLDAYLSRIIGSLDAYERLSSAFIRSVPGALAAQVTPGMDTRRMTSGVEGLSRLVKALVSSRYIKAALEAWGEDLFFLELWQDIQDSPLVHAKAEANSLLPPLKSAKQDADNALFDELITRYGNVASRGEDMVVGQVTAEIESGLKDYFQGQWEKTDRHPPLNESGGLSLPAALAAPVSLLSSCLTFLAQSLPETTLTGIYRRIATAISSRIVQRSVLHRGRQRFTVDEGYTFKLESQMWVDASRMALSAQPAPAADRSFKRGEAPWQELTDAANLVGLPGEVLPEVVNYVLDGSDEEYEKAMSRAGVKSISRDNALAVLRAREDCQR